HIHSHHIINGLNEFSSFSDMFFLSEIKTDPDTIPRYYTDATHTTTAPITDLTPAERKYYLTNRTGIEGYDQINENWK
ncbi:MAG: hypothetical protein LUE93_13420, partial [Bacteroides sp.]|nr:hypothetical protein [Bacteroides sp.]